MALDEATAEMLRAARASGAPPLAEQSPQEAREAASARSAGVAPGPAMDSVRELAAPRADGGEVPIRLLVPRPRPRGVVVYAHGGGWVVGRTEEFDALGRELAERTGCAVAMVQYRKAPEEPFPAAVQDARAATSWVGERLGEIAFPGAPLLVAGDSAGGNLAAVVARRARDEGGPRLAAQVLVYPVTDAAMDTGSYRAPENQLMIDRAAMEWCFRHYAPDESARAHPDVSPLRAENLADLPPAVVVLAEHDVLLDDGLAYAERLRAAGVPVVERIVEGQMHGFFGMCGLLPGHSVAVDHVAAEVDKLLG